MDENEKNRLSRTSMLFITAFSSLLFSLVIKMLDGSYSRILLGVAAIAFISGLLNWAIDFVISKIGKRGKDNGLAS